MPAVAAAGVAAAGLLLLTGRGVVRHGPIRLAGAFRAAAVEGRGVLLRPPAVRPVLITSVLVVAGHVAMFLLAAHAAGVDGAPEQLLPLALVVLLAAGIPLNVGGWGPREGAAAWIFSATQWGAGAGAAVATAFGVLTLVAVLPGAAVLLAGRQRPRAVPPAAPRPEPLAGVVPGGTREDGAAHG
jgi:hypothetical protein